VDNLERALSSFLGHNETVGHLARVLCRASKTSRIAYDEVERIVKDNPEDVLILGNEWRLLVPVRTLKSAAWEDRILWAEPSEIYEMPNIVRYLVEIASETGRWDPGHAVAGLSKTMGGPGWNRISRMVERMREEAEGYRINAVQIKEICTELGLGNKVDVLIAELKASGVMSPRLSLLAEILKVGAPIYELNPSVIPSKVNEDTSL
jgi:hypothetical protein